MLIFPNGMAIRYSSFDLYDANNNNVLSEFTDGGFTSSSGNTVHLGQYSNGVCGGSVSQSAEHVRQPTSVYRWFDECGTSGQNWVVSNGASTYRCKSWCNPWIDLINGNANACLLLTFATPVAGPFTKVVIAGYSPELAETKNTIVHVSYDNAPDTFVEVGHETSPTITSLGNSECGHSTSAYNIPLTT
jgi:hypothetical protein